MRETFEIVRSTTPDPPFDVQARVRERDPRDTWVEAETRAVAFVLRTAGDLKQGFAMVIRLLESWENLARCLIRVPFSMDKIHYDPVAQAVIHKSKIVHGPNRNFEIFDPLDFLAALDSPDPGGFKPPASAGGH